MVLLLGVEQVVCVSSRRVAARGMILDLWRPLPRQLTPSPPPAGAPPSPNRWERGRGRTGAGGDGSVGGGAGGGPHPAAAAATLSCEEREGSVERWWRQGRWLVCHARPDMTCPGYRDAPDHSGLGDVSVTGGDRVAAAVRGLAAVTAR